MEYEIEGSIKIILDMQTFESGFTKREFVITTEEKYPQDVKLELIKEKVDLLDKFSEGQRVKASFNVRGNEFKGKYYVNLQAWKLNPAEGGGQGGGGGEQPPLSEPPADYNQSGGQDPF
jgi:single-strand DNA-binding protein